MRLGCFPRFSVLMSLYYKESPEFLKKSLDSVFHQTLQPDEVVLVEDGPINDELEAVVLSFRASHPELKTVKLPANEGLGKALNKGLKYCSHDLVARMDTDDIAKPERFAKQVDFLVEHLEIDAISAWVEEFIGDCTQIVSVKKVPETHEEIQKYIKKRNPFNHPVVMFRKSAVEKAGGYCHFPLFEDWYLWARMYVAGAKFANIQESLLYFRTSKDMFKRRGGIKYAVDSAKYQWVLHNLGIISVIDAIKSSVLRGFVYLMPNIIRTLIYSKFLRS